MATQVVMPKLSPTMEEGQLARWLKKEGDKVSMGEPLAEIDTDKATMEMQALSNGVLRGRIVKRDIESAIGDQKKTAATKPAVGRISIPRPAREGVVYGPSAYRDEPVSEMRRTIARRLVTSLGPVPHFFLTIEIDMERAADMRHSLNELYPDLKLSINDLIIKVVAVSLIQHPEVNASFQDKTMRYYEHADIGVAVATENGLITPVVRAAELKSITEIATEVRELAERARARRLKPEEYTGATFSISNLGMFGIEEFTAVINPPEGAILAVGAMARKPVAREERVEIRETMRVTMSCDHRVIDGAMGARFLQTFKQIMENPIYLFLDQ